MHREKHELESWSRLHSSGSRRSLKCYHQPPQHAPGGKGKKITEGKLIGTLFFFLNFARNLEVMLKLASFYLSLLTKVKPLLCFDSTTVISFIHVSVCHCLADCSCSKALLRGYQLARAIETPHISHIISVSLYWLPVSSK